MRTPPREIWRLLLAFAAAVTGTLALDGLRLLPWIEANMTALVGAWFLLLPQLFSPRQQIPALLDVNFLRQDLVLFAKISLAILPLFFLGSYLVGKFFCGFGPALFWGSCARLAEPRWRLPASPLLFLLSQWIVIAVPEEYFFRGFLQAGWERLLPASRTLLGAQVGWAIVVTSLLFALGHVLAQGNLLLLSRFFPSLLFGWLFARTRSIFAPSLFHAACNIAMEFYQISVLT